MTTSTKSKSRVLKVIFDTNSLWTTSNTDFVKAEVRALISSHSGHEDLLVSWLAPEIVVEERRYQMLEATRSLLPSMAKLEALFGISVDTSQTALEDRVSTVINRQMAELGLTLLPFAHSDVDWKRVMLRSAHRLPPFEAGKTEKGFRDQLVLESVCELVAASPKTPSSCRIELMTGDKLLRLAVEERLSDCKNFWLFSEPDELTAFVQTLVSNIDDQFIDDVAKKATLLFFEPDNKQSFFVKESVGDQVYEKFGEVINEPAPRGLAPTRERYTLARPNFVKKVNQRTHWASRLTLQMKSVLQPPTEPQNAVLNALRINTDSKSASELAALDAFNRSIEPTALFRTIRIDIAWSANLTQSHNLTKLKLDRIDLSEKTEWAEAGG